MCHQTYTFIWLSIYINLSKLQAFNLKHNCKWIFVKNNYFIKVGKRSKIFVKVYKVKGQWIQGHIPIFDENNFYFYSSNELSIQYKSDIIHILQKKKLFAIK